jgi:hypothetical protein
MPRLSKIGAAALAAFGWTSGTGAAGVTASYLIVAGGGGGSIGGGGAGGYKTGTTSLSGLTTYTVTVGAGGAGQAGTTARGVNGSDSVFNAVTSTGGGGGGWDSPTAAGSGGSGGGAGPNTSTRGFASPVGQGNDGGTNGGFGSPYPAGGGGGAGAVGSNATSTTQSGAGGVGLASSITGTSTYYAGGGGGGSFGGGTGGAGGLGGGGSGANSGNGTAGTANTGGGGGGAVGSSTGGTGGSGVVIISYPAPQIFWGGFITTSGGNVIHTFTTSGSLAPIAATVTANYLQVAGGGGGGSDNAGGGGAGGLLSGTTTLSLSSSYTVTVGAGGAAPTGVGTNGSNGANSQFGALTASVGGGYGAKYNTAGGNGGSGGGGGGYVSSAPAAGAGTAGQGNNGAAGGASAVGGGGGGGGGASAAGTVGSGNDGGAGGAGSASSITGTSVTYAGGGGGGSAITGTGAAGGAGGGGTGGSAQNNNATAGTANLGGGGGGGSYGNGANLGRQGGSGVVIISYAGSTPLFGGGVVTFAGGNTIHTFNTSGTLTPVVSLSANYLIVAGGGSTGSTASGYAGGGGAGAGGLLTGSGLTIDTNSTYLVTVGAGAATVGGSGTNGLQGSNSSFSLVPTTAVGGGGGSETVPTTANGGSGGGATYNYSAGTGTAGQGNNGGTSSASAPNYGGGGGGGAGAVGGNGTSTVAGNGGVGLASSISGTSTYYAGGGGGGVGFGGGTAGTGGLGGGGNGGTPAGGAGGSGTENTGGGAGSGSGNGTFAGGNGGSGIVIISYAGATQLMAGGTVTIVGGNVIHTFTSSGYLSPLTYVGNSLRFRAANTAYLSRTPTVTGSLTTFTYSAWVKLGQLTDNYLFSAVRPGPATDAIRFNASDNSLGVFYEGSGSVYVKTSSVYRDPAAWYHVVVAIDSTQATASNRIKIYVNGSLVTALGIANYPAQNATFPAWNRAGYLQTIGNDAQLALYADQYLTEVRFIDGQALTPNSFGTFNSYGVWQPITYGGSYGTNGFYLPFNAGSSTYAAFFNGSNQKLNTPAGPTTYGTGDFTFECWVNPTTVGTYLPLMATDVTGGAWIGKNGTNFVLRAFSVADLLSTPNQPVAGVWTHIAVTRSGSTAYIFFNGVLQVSGTVTQNFVSGNTYLGTDSGSLYYGGYMSNVRSIIGTALYTSNFTPPTANLTAVSGTSLLTLQNATIVDNSTNAYTITNTNGVTTGQTYPFSAAKIFNDQGPAGNNWTPNNISGAYGSTLDYMTDVPTLTSATAANYAVLNPLYPNGSNVITNGNLTITGAGTYCNGLSTIQLNSGAYYAECTVTTAQAMGWGIWLNSASTTANVGTTPTGFYGIYSGGATLMLNGASPYTNAAGTPSSGDIVQVAWNNGNVWFGKNNVWYNSTFGTTGNPATGANPTVSGLSANAFSIAFCGANASPVLNANFGQQPFVYTPPSGFVALNTYNL